MGIHVFGPVVDDETRCIHYSSERDVIAIRFKCCNRYYPCFECHQQEADHPAQVWPRNEWATPAILCGKCKTELTVNEYLNSNDQCPHCKAPFNPGCRHHYHLYFEG
jgi:uncharacterized CHY-type Zn-finger protein